MRWTSGTASKDFRIDMQLAGERTVLFNRWETRTREQMNGRTYGFNFEKASTRPASGCERSTGHHRIVRYVRIFYFCVCTVYLILYPRRISMGYRWLFASKSTRVCPL